jgi:hypothetical protein
LKKQILVIGLALLLVNCHKTEVLSSNLFLLQNSWAYRSANLILPNGNDSGLIPADFLLIDKNDRAITVGRPFITGIITTDTASYQLLSDNITLILHRLLNAVPTGNPDTVRIALLTTNDLVLDHISSGNITEIDSLIR